VAGTFELVAVLIVSAVLTPDVEEVIKYFLVCCYRYFSTLCLPVYM